MIVELIWTEAENEWCDECLTSAVEVVEVSYASGNLITKLKRCVRCHPWEDEDD